MAEDEYGRQLGAWYRISGQSHWEHGWEGIEYIFAVADEADPYVYSNTDSLLTWLTPMGNVIFCHSCYMDATGFIRIEYVGELVEPLPQYECPECGVQRFLGNDYICVECRGLT